MSSYEILNSFATILPVDKSSTLKCFFIKFIIMLVEVKDGLKPQIAYFFIFTCLFLRPGRGRSVLHILHLLPSCLRNVRHRGLREGDQLNHTPSSLALNLGILILCALCLLVYLVQNIHLPCCDPGGCSLLL